MTKKVNAVKMMLGIMLCLTVLTISLNVSAAGYNEYHGKDYNGSKEEAQEFEQLLRDEGYICVTEGCSDKPEWTEILKETEGLKSMMPYLMDSGEDYRWYIAEFDYQHCIVEGDYPVSALIIESYVVNYYIFNHQTEEGNCTGLIDEFAVEAGYTTGWLTLYFDIGEELKEQPNLTYTLILYGADTNRYYDISASNIGDNSYIARHRLPVDRYTVYNCFVDAEHEPDYSMNSNGSSFRINTGVNRDFHIGFNKISTKGGILSTETYNPEAGLLNNSTEAVQMPDGAVIEKISFSEEKGSDMVKLTLIISLTGITVFVLIIAAIIKKKLSDRENEIE